MKLDLDFRNNREYSFFWGGMFSNWWILPNEMEIDNIKYTSTEQYYMAEKAKFANDNISYEMILKSHDPAEQKQIARNIKDFDSDGWSKISRGIMFKGNYEKYTQDNLLKQFLFSTEDRYLVEASPQDRIWGIGLLHVDAANIDPKFWPGTNWLGIVLTNLKIYLRNEESDFESVVNDLNNF